MASSITMFSYTLNQVPIFEGEHFDYWSNQMETIFLSQDLWDIVEDGFQELPQQQTNGEEWSQIQQNDFKKNVKRNASALRYIQQGLSKSIYPRIHGIKRSKEAWNILKEGFHGNDKVTSIKLQSHWREFDNLSKKDGETMQVYLTRVAEIVNQIRSLGEVIEEKKIVQKVLRSLPPKYDYIVAAIEESKDLSAYTLHDLTCSLQVHEERIGRSSNQPLEEAFGSLNFSNPKQQESKGKFQGQTFQNNDRSRKRRRSIKKFKSLLQNLQKD